MATEHCESCGRQQHDYGLDGCINTLLNENTRLRRINRRQWEALNEIANHSPSCDKGCSEELARATLDGSDA